jgi:glycosyltransferase involved in cell wall biosynthesis
MKTLGILAGTKCAIKGDTLYMHISLGKFIDPLPAGYAKAVLSLPVYPYNDNFDYPLKNHEVDFIPQPPWSSPLAGVKYVWPILKAYHKVISQADILLIRGVLPFMPFIYMELICTGKPLVHWLTGDPLEMRKATRKDGWLMDALMTVYWGIDELFMRILSRFMQVTYLCNGLTLFKKFKRSNTVLVLPGSISEKDFYYREDTCQQKTIRILCVAFVRPEKGLEYLIQAIARMKNRDRVQLALVGKMDPEGDYARKLLKLVDDLNLADRIEWVGFRAFGPDLFEEYKKADIFAFPSLSEGLPSVLIEARAFGLPVVSTDVGGILSTVQHGVDGLLVPPADPGKMSYSIDKIIEEQVFRRRLIKNGYKKAFEGSIETYKNVLISALNSVYA